jgi:ATP-binding cassette subfamily B protein
VIRHSWRQVAPLLHHPARTLIGLAAASTAVGLAEALVLVAVLRVALLAAGHPTSDAVHVPGFGDARPSALLWVSLGLAVACLVLHAVITHLAARTTAEVLTGARARAIDSFVDASWDRQDRERDGALQEAVSTLADQAAGMVMSFVAGVAAALNIAAFLAVATVLDPVPTLGILALAVPLFLALRPLARITRRRARRYVAANTALAIDVSHFASLAMEHRVYGVRRDAADRLLAQSRHTSGLQEASRFASRFGALLYRDLAVLVLIGAVAVLGATSGQPRLAGIGTVAVLVLRALTSAQILQAAIHGVRELGPNLDALDARARSLEASRPPGGEVATPTIGAIELRDVGYTYPGGGRALDRVSLRVEPGEAIGVIGPSGGGKSTLAQVLLRLRLPTDGELTVGGVAYEHVAEADWSRLVALVPQEPRLMEGTVAENIAFLRPHVSRAQVEQAAADTHIDAEIRDLPDGFDTVLGRQGAGLSVGQKQRVAIARALAGDPRLLVLDEPTSALDVVAERLIQETIARLNGEITMIVIAHRLSTLRFCDRVLVLRDGAVETIGPPGMVLRRYDVHDEADAGASLDLDAGQARTVSARRP